MWEAICACQAQSIPVALWALGLAVFLRAQTAQTEDDEIEAQTIR
jgi:hypothetical protein